MLNPNVLESAAALNATHVCRASPGTLRLIRNARAHTANPFPGTRACAEFYPAVFPVTGSSSEILAKVPSRSTNGVISESSTYLCALRGNERVVLDL